MSAFAAKVAILLAGTAGVSGSAPMHTAHVGGKGHITHKTKEITHKAITHKSDVANKPSEQHGDEKILDALDKIYSGNSLHPFWEAGNYKNSDKELISLGLKQQDAKAATYNEIKPKAFLEMMKTVGAKPGMKFYDLGSGTGKAVYTAWLLGLDATGVEAIEKRYHTSCSVLKKAHAQQKHKDVKQGAAHFMHENFMKMDFSDADILYADSAAFTKPIMDRLGEISQTLKKGAKIITTKSIPGEGFDLETGVVAATAQSLGTEWTIMTRTAEPKHPALPSSATTVLAKVEEHTAPASLIRQEPASLEDHEHRLSMAASLKGPVIGLFREKQHDEAAPAGSVCSLTEKGIQTNHPAANVPAANEIKDKKI